MNALNVHVIMSYGCEIAIKQDHFWVVYNERKPGIFDSWPRAKYQVNGVAKSCHKKFSMLYELLTVSLNIEPS